MPSLQYSYVSSYLIKETPGQQVTTIQRRDGQRVTGRQGDGRAVHTSDGGAADDLLVGHADQRRVLRVVRLDADREHLAVGLARAGLAVVADATHRQHGDGGEDTEDRDHDQQLDEGEALVALGRCGVRG